MKERLGKLLEFCLDEGRRHYDPEAGLIGDFDPRFYTEKMLAEHFNALSLRSLHPYRDSLTFALLLLIAGGKDEKISAVLESFCRHAPEPDGRLKWFLEEKHIRDGNGTFFSVEPLLLMEHCFGGELPEFQRKQVISILKNTYHVFVRERSVSSWSYVNPTLAAYTFSGLLSEKFFPENFEPDLAEFKRYIAYLTENGVAENYTTTYLTVDTLILLCVLIVSGSRDFRETARRFLFDVIFRETMFFEARFPAPFRRGYNGYYETERKDVLACIFGWTSSFDTGRDPALFMIATAVFLLYTEKETLVLPENSALPRELTMKIHEDCRGVSFLDEKFLIGAFDSYPSRENIVWQCVTAGGSGWQDGPVYATFENRSKSSMILRLEAVDGKNQFNCHPYEGNFCMEKVHRLYEWRSFPPEPKIRTLLRRNSLLCLFKIDRIDGILKRLGFNLRFSRFEGDVLDLNGTPLPDGIHQGPLIVALDDILVYLHPLKRVRMKGASLAVCNGFHDPEFCIGRKEEILELAMFNLDEPEAALYTQNHVSGGFLLHVESGVGRECFLERMRLVKVSDVFVRNRINACIDERDAVRTVEVEVEDEKMSLSWDHYSA